MEQEQAYQACDVGAQRAATQYQGSPHNYGAPSAAATPSCHWRPGNIRTINTCFMCVMFRLVSVSGCQVTSQNVKNKIVLYITSKMTNR